MDADDVIETLPIADWHGPFDPVLKARALDALEAGQVLSAHLPFSLAPDEAFLLSPSVMGSERKNISFDAASGQVGNTSLSGADAERLRTMLRRFGDVAETLLRDLLPSYAPTLERARTSFRPAEIAGREILAAPRRQAAPCRRVPQPADARSPHPANVHQRRSGWRRAGLAGRRAVPGLCPPVLAARRRRIAGKRLVVAAPRGHQGAT